MGEEKVKGTQGKVKRKVGRPSKEDEEKNKRIAVYLTEYELEVFMVLKQRLSVDSNSGVVRFLVNKYARTLGIIK